MKVKKAWLDRGAVRLRVRRWIVPGAPAGVLIVHGFGEHAGRYLHVAERLVRAGLEVTSFDLRGHGESGGARGDFDHYDSLLDDLGAAVALARETVPKLFFYAHSFGAQLCIRKIERGETRVAGAVFSAPWLRLAMRPPAWKLATARMAARWLPTLRMSTGVRAEMLSRDLAFLVGLDPEGLAHRSISVRAFWQAALQADLAIGEANRFRIPFLLAHGEKDALMDPTASLDFASTSASTDYEVKSFPEGLHETHNDLQRDEWLDQVAEWITTRSQAGC